MQALGVPINIASHSLLTLMIAHVTGLKVKAEYQETKLSQAAWWVGKEWGAGGGGGRREEGDS